MIEILRKRRSIRKFSDKKIEPEKIDILKEAVLRSPSSRNILPWEFIFVDDKDLLLQLSRSKAHGSAFLAGASLGIVVLGDEKKSDVWVEDCSIASIIVHLITESLELGSCWIQIRNRQHSDSQTAEEYIQKLLNVPGNYRVESIIGIGYPGEKKPGIPEEELKYNKIRENKF